MNTPTGFTIVGLTGTHGSGKGATVDYLVSRGFKHFSARDLLWQEVDRRGLARDRTSLGIVANSLRAKFGPEHVAYALYIMARQSQCNAIIESIYTMGEIAKIREAANRDRFILVALDADIRIRYDRIRHQRGSETDNLSFDQFVVEQEREMSSPDPHKHNLLACRNAADIKIMNNGTLEELHAQIDQLFSGF